MKTSKEVYNRILHDSTFDPKDFIIGYVDRFHGISEIPLTSWIVDQMHENYIPWHRVVYFKDKHRWVWDRKRKLDGINKFSLETISLLQPIFPTVDCIVEE